MDFMSASAILESIRQVVTSAEGSGLTVVIGVSEDVQSADVLTLHVGNDRLSFSAGGCTRSVSFIAPVDARSAASKFSRRRATLTITSSLIDVLPIAVSSAAAGRSLHARMTVGSLGRGVATLTLALPHVAKGTPCYALVSRSGEYAELGAGGYTWCHCFTKEAGHDMLCVHFDCAAWVWDSCDDALVTYGVLGEGAAHPSIEAGCEQSGVEWGSESSDSSAATPSHSVVLLSSSFTPEESDATALVTAPTP